MIKITGANWDRVNLYLTVEKDFINEAYLLDRNDNKFVLPVKNNVITINHRLATGIQINVGFYDKAGN